MVGGYRMSDNVRQYTGTKRRMNIGSKPDAIFGAPCDAVFRLLESLL